MLSKYSEKMKMASSRIKQLMEQRDEDTVNAIQDAITDTTPSVFNAKRRLEIDLSKNSVIGELKELGLVVIQCRHRSEQYQVIIEPKSGTAMLMMSRSALNSDIGRVKKGEENFLGRLCNGVNGGGRVQRQATLFDETATALLESDQDRLICEKFLDTYIDVVDQLLIFAFAEEEGVVQASVNKYDGNMSLLGYEEVNTDGVVASTTSETEILSGTTSEPTEIVLKLRDSPARGHDASSDDSSQQK
jgi:hypothetical protein